MPDNLQYSSPLRYPGGKEDLSQTVEHIIVNNQITGIDYAEPFAGGAGLALHLLFGGYVTHIYINDLNAAIYAFWNSVLNNTDEICKKIHDVSITVDEWAKQQQVLENPETYSTVELGFAAFFLNRTSHSGIIGGGILGGKEQKSKYKIDCRFKKESLIQRIIAVARRRNDISVSGLDAVKFIQNVVNLNPNDCLSFLDPPYYKNGQQLYYNFYEHDDHVRLSNIVSQELREPWIVTYDNVPEIRNLYNQFTYMNYEINYSAQIKRKGHEIMYFSPGLKQN